MKAGTVIENEDKEGRHRREVTDGLAKIIYDKLEEIIWKETKRKLEESYKQQNADIDKKVAKAESLEMKEALGKLMENDIDEKLYEHYISFKNANVLLASALSEAIVGYLCRWGEDEALEGVPEHYGNGYDFTTTLSSDQQDTCFWGHYKDVSALASNLNEWGKRIYKKYTKPELLSGGDILVDAFLEIQKQLVELRTELGKFGEKPVPTKIKGCIQ